MLLFSLALQPLIRKITRGYGVKLNRWYGNNGTLLGPVDEVSQALRTLYLESTEFSIAIYSSRI